jgi:hypothetical protein
VAPTGKLLAKVIRETVQMHIEKEACLMQASLKQTQWQVHGSGIV